MKSMAQPWRKQAMGHKLKRVLLEALMIAAVGLALSLLANLASPRGLSLTRDYFPGGKTLHTETNRSANASVNGASPATNGVGHSARESAVARLKEKGLQAVDDQEAMRLFRDPQYELESIVFIDARDDRHYQEGHIPGAYQFDRYYPEKHLPAVLPACQNASKIVVYCTGGNCEDSEFAALTLKEASVPPDRLLVYVGGITEWTANGWPVEVGERKSGKMQSAKP
jgi:rhodanese-related sulfurtransferase